MDCSKLSTRADDARCEKQCSKKRDCLRHKCGQKCCILLEHVCPLVIIIFNKPIFVMQKTFFVKSHAFTIEVLSFNNLFHYLWIPVVQPLFINFYYPFFHAKPFFVKSHALVLKFCHLTIFFIIFEFQLCGSLLSIFIRPFFHAKTFFVKSHALLISIEVLSVNNFLLDTFFLQFFFRQMH